MKNSIRAITLVPRVANDMNHRASALKARAILAWGNAPGSLPIRPSGLKARAKISAPL
jgi:hypothetical protein